MTNISASSSTLPRPFEATVEEQQPFSSRQISLPQAELIQLKWDANYWKAQHKRSCVREEKLKKALADKDAEIRDLKQLLFVKKSEKGATSRDQTDLKPNKEKRPRGQQKGSRGHARTERPDLPVKEEDRDLTEEACCCRQCGLPYNPFPGTEDSEIFEVSIRAHKRRVKRKRYKKGCLCSNSGANPGIITAPVAPKVIPKSPYGISVWEQALLGKFLHAQPLNRILQDLNGLGLPIASGTLTGGLKKLATLFEPIYQALCLQQRSEDLFHNDESRWEVYEAVEGKIGHRWYLWVTCSRTVIYYRMDSSRSADVPIAHFCELETERAIVVCDRYGAYKKLARINDVVTLAFCWAHVRRDFLEVARGFPELKEWGLDWVEAIGRLYHLNQQRLDSWQMGNRQQSPAFQEAHLTLANHLEHMKEQCDVLLQADQQDRTRNAEEHHKQPGQHKPLHSAQRKVLRSFQNHLEGLTVFVDHPEVPMDNNLAEQAIRNPVNGRKNYYGSGSVWSAHLAATMFSIFQTLGLWDLNPRHWLREYLQACAEKAGQAPTDINPFLPWKMDEARRQQLARPPDTSALASI
jgi:transposase